MTGVPVGAAAVAALVGAFLALAAKGPGRFAGVVLFAGSVLLVLVLLSSAKGVAS